LREFRGMADVQPKRYAYGAAGMTLLQHGGLARRMLRGHHRELGDKLAMGMNRHLVEDSRTDLANLIRYADRTSMAFGVESRMPFLDVRLATFLASLPEAYKVHRGWTKYIARKAFDHALPDSVTWRKDKMGWPIPERVWADGPLKDWFDRPRSQAGRFDEWGVGSEFRACLNSGSMTERVRALNLSAWAETFCDGGWRSMT
jgi:asparagine synthase (glutamine-hydrolysing)